MNSFIRGLINFLLGVISGAAEEAQSNTSKPSQRQPSSKPTSSTPKPRSSSSSRPNSGSHHHYEDPATSNRPQTSIHEASIADALAHASYTPVMDGDADPGEVIWTWVPYQEDASVGKDRPAVVIGAQGEGVYVLQLTSKDHTRTPHRRPRLVATGSTSVPETGTPRAVPPKFASTAPCGSRPPTCAARAPSYPRRPGSSSSTPSRSTTAPTATDASDT